MPLIKSMSVKTLFGHPLFTVTYNVIKNGTEMYFFNLTGKFLLLFGNNINISWYEMYTHSSTY